MRSACGAETISAVNGTYGGRATVTSTSFKPLHMLDQGGFFPAHELGKMGDAPLVYEAHSHLKASQRQQEVKFRCSSVRRAAPRHAARLGPHRSLSWSVR